MKKRILAFLMAAVMVISLLPVPAFADVLPAPDAGYSAGTGSDDNCFTINNISGEDATVTWKKTGDPHEINLQYKLKGDTKLENVVFFQGISLPARKSVCFKNDTGKFSKNTSYFYSVTCSKAYTCDALPELSDQDYTVTGLISGDELTGIMLRYEGEPDMSRAGSYTILVTDTEADSGRNYSVFCVNGTLNVNDRPISGNSGSVTSYPVKVNETVNGSASADRKSSYSGSTVTVTAEPDKGYTVESVVVLDWNDRQIEVKTVDRNTFKFTMQSSAVTVTVTFMEDNAMLNACVDMILNTNINI